MFKSLDLIHQTLQTRYQRKALKSLNQTTHTAAFLEGWWAGQKALIEAIQQGRYQVPSEPLTEWPPRG